MFTWRSFKSALETSALRVTRAIVRSAYLKTVRLDDMVDELLLSRCHIQRIVPEFRPVKVHRLLDEVHEDEACRGGCERARLPHNREAARRGAGEQAPVFNKCSE